MTKIKKNCIQCGKEFETYRSPNRKEGMYCGKECKDAAWTGTELVKTRIEVTCLQCGKRLLRYPSHVNDKNFCDPSCKASYTMLGNKHREGKRPSNAFTRDQVSGKNNAKWVEPIHLVCKNCGKSFERKPWKINQRGNTGDFCGATCREEYKRKYQSGEASPFWVGGINTYRGRDWKSARLVAVERDGGVCQSCGVFMGNSIPVHHIIPFREFDSAEKANAVDNLICYCQSCHMKKEPRPTTKAQVVS